MRTRKSLRSCLRKTQTAAERRRRRRAVAETIRRRAQARACCRPGRRTRTRSVSSSAAATAKLVGNGKFSDKLEALKNLIPSSSHFKNGDVEEDHDQTVKTEQLFQETADYIILLRTRVVVLQRLIEFYGSATTSTTCRENQNDNHVNVLL